MTRTFPGLHSLRYPLRAAEDDTGGGTPAEPVAEPAEEPAEAPADPEPEPTPEPVAAEAAAEEEPPKPPRIPWHQRRIDQLTAQNKTAQEETAVARKEAEDAKQRAAAYEALYGKPEGEPAAPAADGERRYTQSELQQEAQRIASLNVLNQKCETLFETGSKTHGAEWNKRIEQAGLAFKSELSVRPDFFDAVTGLANGADVYHALTGDLDQLDDVLHMSPVQMGMHLANLSTKLATKPKGPAISKAPDPIDPIEGAASAKEVDLAKAGMDDYVRIREKQREERYASRN